MGLAASQGRFLLLTARKGDLEFQGQQINNQRMTLSEQLSQIQQAIVALSVPDVSSTNYESEKVVYDAKLAQEEAKAEVLHMDDRRLEIFLKEVDTQHNEVQTEIDGVKKVIEKNIESTFKTFA